MAGPTLLWLREHEPAHYGAARWALQPKDWLRLRLTGEALTEPSDASGTLLYDPEHDRWALDVVSGLGLHADLLARLVASGSVAGGLTVEAAAHLGLLEGTPVVVGGADTAAALLGTGLGEGQVQLTVGTGAQLVIRHRELPPPQRALHLFRTAETQGWYSLAAIQNAGLALEWARRALRCDWEEFYALAREAPAGSRGLVFLPYLTGDRTPHLNPRARGGWTGAGLEHGPEHLARAAFEGVALSIREALAVMPPAQTDVIRLAGGGSVHPWWRQMLADTLDRPLQIVDVPSASVVWAAMLAGAPAEGARASADRAPEVTQPHPDPGLEERAERFTAVYDGLYGGAAGEG